MSKYDVEVEGRLQALEKQAHPTPTGATQKKVEDRLAALEKAVAEIGAKCDSRFGAHGRIAGARAHDNHPGSKDCARSCP